MRVQPASRLGRSLRRSEDGETSDRFKAILLDVGDADIHRNSIQVRDDAGCKCDAYIRAFAVTAVNAGHDEVVVRAFSPSFPSV
jgi:hypothetical protein